MLIVNNTCVWLVVNVNLDIIVGIHDGTLEEVSRFGTAEETLFVPMSNENVEYLETLSEKVDSFSEKAHYHETLLEKADSFNECEKEYYTSKYKEYLEEIYNTRKSKGFLLSGWKKVPEFTSFED